MIKSNLILNFKIMRQLKQKIF